MAKHSPTTTLLSALARTLGRDPYELIDAYGSGDGIPVIENNCLVAYAYALALHRPGARGHKILKFYRVITTVWVTEDLDPQYAEALGRRVLGELVERLKSLTVIVTADVAAAMNVKTTDLGSVDLRVRYRAMDALGVPHGSSEEHRAANATVVGIVYPTEEETVRNEQILVPVEALKRVHGAF